MLFYLTRTLQPEQYISRKLEKGVPFQGMNALGGIPLDHIKILCLQTYNFNAFALRRTIQLSLNNPFSENVYIRIEIMLHFQ